MNQKFVFFFISILINKKTLLLYFKNLKIEIAKRFRTKTTQTEMVTR